MEWFYVQEGRQCGPVSRGELDQLVESGQVSPQALIWNESMGDWQAYEDAPAASDTTTSSGMSHCAECGEWQPEAQVTRIGSRTVCDTCKPKFSSKLSENHSTQAASKPKAWASGGDNTTAIIGLVLSILGTISCGLLAIPGLILSIRGIAEANAKEGQPGKKIAVAGLIVAIVGLTLQFGVAAFRLFG